MKQVLIAIAVILFLACGNTRMQRTVTEPSAAKAQDTVRIASDSEEVEYEIIIIEPGFNSWLVTQAQPRGFYTQSFLEGRNRIYVTEWNNRFLQPLRYGNLYNMQIDYDPRIDYGYEVNYMLYNYFIFFQLRYKQQLAGFVPRI